MFWPDSDEAQVGFHEASAYFSEDEWKLLHKWQKELYRNVMKEIHKALISLGPLVTTTVFSLISKEKEEMIPLENQDSVRRRTFNHSANYTVANPDMTFRINRVENQYVKAPHNIEKSENKECFNTDFKPDACLRKEEPASLFIDHLGDEVRETNTDPNLGYEVVSFCIKGEEETHCMDYQNNKTIENISSQAAGNGSMNRKRNVSNALKSKALSTACKSMAKNLKATGVQNAYERKKCINLVCSVNDQKLRQTKTANWQSPLNQGTQSNMQQITTPHAQRSEPCNKYENTVRSDSLLQSKSNQLQICTPYTYSGRGQSSQKNSYAGHQQAPKGKGRYTCIACEKHFSAKSILIRHERIHTGERPYHCTICGKSFNQREVLQRHQQMHSGERPFQCNICGKSFNRRYHLVGHQKTHTSTQRYFKTSFLETVTTNNVCVPEPNPSNKEMVTIVNM